jgi:hypothetical protein
MEHEITAGTVLIKGDTLLPLPLQFEAESGIPDWKIVKGLDALALERRIRQTGWTFFSRAGRATARAFGSDRAAMLRRAITGILAKKNSHGFNSLEILEVSFAGSEKFPLVRHLTVAAQWRHIQRDVIAASARKVSNRPLSLSGVEPRRASPSGDFIPQRLIA